MRTGATAGHSCSMILMLHLPLAPAAWANDVSSAEERHDRLDVYTGCVIGDLNLILTSEVRFAKQWGHMACSQQKSFVLTINLECVTLRFSRLQHLLRTEHSQNLV